MTDKYTVSSFLQQLMQGADENYRTKTPFMGVGFVVSAPRATDDRRVCGFIRASAPVATMPRLRRFTAVVRDAMKKATTCTEAGVLCELDISLDQGSPECMVVLYLDQRYAGMRVFVAPKCGEHLVFRDLGTAFPTTNFFPPLFTAEAYGTSQADA